MILYSWGHCSTRCSCAHHRREFDYCNAVLYGVPARDSSGSSFVILDHVTYRCWSMSCMTHCYYIISFDAVGIRLRCICIHDRVIKRSDSLVFTARCTTVQSAVLPSHVVRPSVCLSVRDVGDSGAHIGWKSWKLIARTLSPTPSLFGPQRSSPTPRGTWGNFGETRGGVGKWRSGAQKRQYLWNAWRYRKSYYGRAIGTHHRSFDWYHPQPPTASPSSRLLDWGSHPNQNYNRYYLRNW